MSNKIIPRNLTARAEYNVPGNPPTTRPESGVGNCYPGLEYDHRNLDRRFFPGLVFEYISPDGNGGNVARSGARLVATDTGDEELQSRDPRYRALASALSQLLQGDTGTALNDPDARWFLLSLTQEKKTIEMTQAQGGLPLDGAIVWRMIRSLRAEEVTIVLGRRDENKDKKPETITLKGWRRRYTDPSTGVIPLSFQPGELTQSLCSPWMHDFRDCACTYWASNHPDIVFAEIPVGDPTDPSAPLPSGMSSDALRGSTRLDWLRADRSWSASSAISSSNRANVERQMSHFEINTHWKDLAIVLENRETPNLYIPRVRRGDQARPYASPTELRDQLIGLAGLEHLVILLYLYARYTLLSTDEAKNFGAGTWPTLLDDVEFVRHQLLDVATSEMQHLRSVNLLLSLLAETKLIPGWTYEPSVTKPALVIPGAGGVSSQTAVLTPLTSDTIKLFVAIEEPSGDIDGRYARATATLLQAEYPRHLYQLASTIDRDGEDHFLKFRDIQLVLAPYGKTNPVYLRPVKEGDPGAPGVQEALKLYQDIVNDLFLGYFPGSIRNKKDLATARQLMFALDTEAEKLAASGIGIPYLSLFRKP